MEEKDNFAIGFALSTAFCILTSLVSIEYIGIYAPILIGFILGAVHLCTYAKNAGAASNAFAFFHFINISLMMMWLHDQNKLAICISFLVFVIFLGCTFAFVKENGYNGTTENREKLTAELSSIVSLLTTAYTAVSFIVGDKELKTFISSEKPLMASLLTIALIFKTVSITLKIRIAYQKIIKDRQDAKAKQR